MTLIEFLSLLPSPGATAMWVIVGTLVATVAMVRWSR